MRAFSATVVVAMLASAGARADDTPTAGTVYIGGDLRTIRVDDGYVTLGEDGSLVLPCGRHVLAWGLHSHTIDLPCGGDVVLEGGRRPLPPPDPSSFTTIHVEGDGPADVEENVGYGWRRVCSLPCDATLSTERAYRIGGRGVLDSKPLRIDPDRPRLVVSTASSAVHGLGRASAVTGILGFAPAAGVTVLSIGIGLLSLLWCPVYGYGPGNHSSDCFAGAGAQIGHLYTAPVVWIPALVGVPLVVGGGLALRSETTVSTMPSSPLARRRATVPTLTVRF